MGVSEVVSSAVGRGGISGGVAHSMSSAEAWTDAPLAGGALDARTNGSEAADRPAASTPPPDSANLRSAASCAGVKPTESTSTTEYWLNPSAEAGKAVGASPSARP